LCQNLAAVCYNALGRHDEARSAARRSLARIEKEIALRPDNTHAMALGVGDLAYLGEKERAKEWASRVLIIQPEDAGDYHNLACALVQLNELDGALDLLERYTPKMAPERIDWIKRDIDLEPLHHDPRFQALIAQCEARLAQVQAEHSATRH